MFHADEWSIYDIVVDTSLQYYLFFTLMANKSRLKIKEWDFPLTHKTSLKTTSEVLKREHTTCF